jgi:WS/DGAT/MGAT family acyltransferase
MEDTQFLVYETPTSPMHVGGLMIFERGPLATEDGGVDIETIRKGVASVLHKVPRFRQRLKWIPVANHPVWVDDPHLDIRYHVRHTSLPRPGSMAQLKQLVARVMSQQLDRDKPLWEWWVIEGLEDDAFAVFTKIHHCMMDGTSGADLSHVLMNVEPEWSYGATSSRRPTSRGPSRRTRSSCAMRSFDARGSPSRRPGASATSFGRQRIWAGSSRRGCALSGPRSAPAPSRRPPPSPARSRPIVARTGA